jgi:hypothetical protein
MTGAEMLIVANGWWFGSIISFILGILIAFGPARVAARKGHSFSAFPFQSGLLPGGAHRDLHGQRSSTAGSGLNTQRP